MQQHPARKQFGVRTGDGVTNLPLTAAAERGREQEVRYRFGFGLTWSGPQKNSLTLLLLSALFRPVLSLLIISWSQVQVLVGPPILLPTASGQVRNPMERARITGLYCPFPSSGIR
jgi:hypothetical protein